MNFGFSEEQNLLRDQVARFMQEACPMRKVRELSNSDSRMDTALWKQAAELGWLGLTVPEQYGGLGLKWIDLTVVLEELGKGLSPLPMASHTLSCAALLECAPEDKLEQWLPMMVAGDTVCTVALYDEPNWIDPRAITATATIEGDTVTLGGVKPFVNDALAATHFIFAVRTTDGLGLATVAREQITVNAQPMMDPTKGMGSISLEGVTMPSEYVFPMSEAQLEYLTDCGAMATTAEMVGAADAILELTSGYAKERIQFGKPIGQYQGVTHRLAEMYVDVESFKSLCYYAAWTVDDARDEMPRAVSLAKGYASDAFAQIGIDGVGLHGAIGFTAEYDAQLYLKRSKWARPMYGDSDYHLDRVAALGGL